MKKLKFGLKFIAFSMVIFILITNYISQNIIVNAAVATDSPGDSNSEGITQGDNFFNTLKKYTKSNIDVQSINTNDGQIFISGTLSDKELPSVDGALKFLDRTKSILGIQSTANNFKENNISTDDIGYKHIELDQYISGLPILGRKLTVHYNNEGIITAFTGNITSVTNVTKLGNKNITSNEAIEIAKNLFKSAYISANNGGATQKNQLETDNSLEPVKEGIDLTGISSEPTSKKMAIILGNEAYEVYSVNVSFFDESNIPENWDVYVEASSGKVIGKQSRNRDEAVKGTGTGVDGSTKELNLEKKSNGYYYMNDLSKPSLNALSNNITTLTADHSSGSSIYSYTSNNGKFTAEYAKSLVDAHYNAGEVYDFYKNLFNQNSIDNKGMTIYSVAHIGTNYNNAFWNGKAMWYGDGDGTTFTYLSGDLDVVGHEMTHGVTENKGDLNYHNQTGSLNESISDVFGVLIETYSKYNVKNNGTWQFNAADWVVGDDVYTPNIKGDALRSLAAPTLYNQPDNMDAYVKVADDTAHDNGGVHVNSGIPNKAAFLIAKSIGMAKTAAIYYRGYKYLNYNIDFKGAALAYIQAATDLYGANSAEVNSVKIAFATVKVISIPPTVSSTTPTNNGTNIAVNTPITIKFSKPIVAGTNYSKITVKTSGGTAVSITPSISNDTLTLSHKTNFVNGTTYVVTIPVGAVNDKNGTAIANQYTFKFTTVKVISMPPTVSSTTPTNNGTNITVNAPITLKFSKSIVAATNYSKITVKTAGGNVISVTSSISNNTLTLSHKTNFVNGTTYIVTIPVGAIKDKNGVALANQYTFKFTTIKK